jgi:UDP-N-acetylglucosamine 2-epimerase (non-hydrolysing)
MTVQQCPGSRRKLTLVRPDAATPAPASPGAAWAGGGARGTVVHAVGTRSGYPRIAPVIAELDRMAAFRQLIVDLCPAGGRVRHEALDEIGVPQPSRTVTPGRGTPGGRLAHMLSAFERVLLRERAALVVLVGDVDATLACALAATRLHIPVARVEAGLRDGDWSSDQEANRVLTDRLGDALFTDSPEAEDNLRREGITDGRTHYVGNTIVDWLQRWQPAARRRNLRGGLGLGEHEYVLVALHEPATVGPGRAPRLAEALVALAERAPVVLPLRARSAGALSAAGLGAGRAPVGLHRLGPLGFLDFLSVAGDAGAIVTDSGHVQEEASALGVPCFTLAATTERRVTLTHGTNVLLGDDPELTAVAAARHPPTPCAIPLWDGHAGERVAELLVANFALRKGMHHGR